MRSSGESNMNELVNKWHSKCKNVFDRSLFTRQYQLVNLFLSRTITPTRTGHHHRHHNMFRRLDYCRLVRPTIFQSTCGSYTFTTTRTLWCLLVSFQWLDSLSFGFELNILSRHKAAIWTVLYSTFALSEAIIADKHATNQSPLSFLSLSLSLPQFVHWYSIGVTWRWTNCLQLWQTPSSLGMASNFQSPFVLAKFANIWPSSLKLWPIYLLFIQ